LYGAVDPDADAGPLLGEKDVAEFRSRLDANPAFDGAFYHRGDSRHAVILFKSDNYLHDPNPYRIRLVDDVRSLVARYPRVRVDSLVGTTVINAELNRASRKDSLVFYVLVTFFIGLAGRVLLGNWKDWSVLMAVVSISALVPMALIAASHAAFNMVTVMVPPVLITLSVCDVIHVINAFHGERRSREAHQALNAAIGKIWTPCLWTSVITVAGFLALAQSTVVPIWQLGVYCAVGIALAWAVTMSLAPVMLAFFWPGKSVPDATHPVRIGRFSSRLFPYLFGPTAWFWIGLQLLMLAFLVWIPKVKVDTDYTRFFGARTRVTRSYAAVKQAGFGQSPVSVVLRYPKGTHFYAQGRLAGLLAFEKDLKADSRVMKLLSVTDLIRRTDEAFNPAGGTGLAAYSEDKVGQLLFLAELAGNDDIKDFTTENRDELQLVVMAPYLGSTELGSLKAAILEKAKSDLPPDVSAEVDGTTVLWADMDRQISRTQMESIYLITAVFFVLMPLVFRSLLYGLIGVFVNSLPLAVTFGLMGLLGIRIDMATALIGGVAIGSTVDSTIFFINRFRQALEAGLGWEDAVKDALLNVGDGIIMTSLILAGGFLCLSVSDFLPTAHFGALVTASILVALYLDIMIDPIVLRWAGRLAVGRRGHASKSAITGELQ
jgi:hypothetical protein